MSHSFWNTLSLLALVALLLSACQSSRAAAQPPAQPNDPSTVVVTAQAEVPPTVTLTTQPEVSPTSVPSPTPGPTSPPAPLRSPLWTFPTNGEVWSSPTVADGVVYFGSDDHFLYALDAASHQLIWKFETGDLVRSRPAVDRRVVYFTSDDNFLYALDTQTGAELWRFDLGKANHPRGPLAQYWDYLQSSPAVAEGVVYVGSANPNFYAVDARTGQEKWRFTLKYSTRSSPAVVDGTVYVGESDLNVYAIDAQTGLEKWRFDTGSTVIPSPTVVDGVVYVGSKAPYVYALDAQTGQEKWRFNYPPSIAWVESSAAVANGTVYVGSSDWRRLNAIDAATGQLKWYFLTKGFPWCSPAVAEGVVYIGGTGGYFYAVGAETGQELWNVQTGKSLVTETYGVSGGVVSSPVIADGVIYFGSLDGQLYAVSTQP